MKNLQTEPVIFDKVRKVVIGLYSILLIIALLYLFVLITAPTNGLTLKTFLTIIITITFCAVLPFCTMRMLTNARKKDENNALNTIAEQIKQSYSVSFYHKPCVNRVAILMKDNGERFYGVVSLNSDNEPVVKELKDYESI